MSFCSELNAKLDTIIQLLQSTGLSCCPDNATYLTPPDVSLDGSGDVPQSIIDAGYATGVTDWVGYNEYKCMVSHIVIDNLITKFQDLPVIVTAGAGLLSLLLVLFGSITGFSGVVILGAAIGLGDVLALIDVLKDLTTGDMSSIAEGLEDHRDALVCAMMGGDGIDDVRADFDSAVDANFSALEASAIKLMNLGPTFATLFGGVYGGVDAADVLATYGESVDDYTCPCTGDAIGKIAIITYGTISGKVAGDLVYDGEFLEFTSGDDGAGVDSIYFNLTNVAGNGPLEGNHDWLLVSQSGWSSYLTADKAQWTRKSTAPYYQFGANYDADFSTPPIYLVEDNGTTAGWRLNSNTPWSGVLRISLQA